MVKTTGERLTGFDVHVHQTSAVDVLETHGHLEEQVPQLRLCECLSLDLLLHDHVMETPTCGASEEDGTT